MPDRIGLFEIAFKCPQVGDFRHRVRSHQHLTGRAMRHVHLIRHDPHGDGGERSLQFGLFDRQGMHGANVADLGVRGFLPLRDRRLERVPGVFPQQGPQLAAILSLAAQEGSTARGTILLGIYALGLGLPFLLAAIFVERSMGLMTRLKRHMKLIERAMGVLLLIVGLALLTGAFTDFSYWMLELYGAMGIPVPG